MSRSIEWLLDRYSCNAPGLRACGEGDDDPCCADCIYSEMDAEVDACDKHTPMYHDWDMPEDENFIFRLICNDFKPKENRDE